MGIEMQHYCYLCGGTLLPEYENGFFRERCSKCGEIHYRQYKLGVAAIIINDGKLLLAERNYEPWKGFWNLPAGFVEIEESLEQAVARETLEETGYKVDVLKLHKVITYRDDPRGDGLVLFYDCKLIDGKFAANEEASDCNYFSKNDLPKNIAGAGHQSMIQSLIAEGLVYD